MGLGLRTDKSPSLPAWFEVAKIPTSCRLLIAGNPAGWRDVRDWLGGATEAQCGDNCDGDSRGRDSTTALVVGPGAGSGWREQGLEVLQGRGVVVLVGVSGFSGLVDVRELVWRTWLALPGAQRTRWLIPLQPPKAIATAFELHGTVRRTRRMLKGMVRRLVSRFPNRIPSRFTVQVVSPRQRDDGDTLLAVVSHTVEDVVNCSVLTPLAGIHDKVVLGLLSTDGELVGVVKASSASCERQQIELEEMWLRRLGGQIGQGFLVPECLGSGTFDRRRFVIQTPIVGGVVPAPRAVPTWLSRLQLALVARAEGSELDGAFWRGCIDRAATTLDDLEPAFRSLLLNLHRRVVERLAASTVPAALAHRDLTPWNVRVLSNCVAVIDWEHARMPYPPLLDVFHYLVQGHMYKDAEAIRVVSGMFANRRAMRLIQSVHRLLSISVDNVFDLLVFYLFDFMEHEHYEPRRIRRIALLESIVAGEGSWRNRCLEALKVAAS